MKTTTSKTMLLIIACIISSLSLFSQSPNMHAVFDNSLQEAKEFCDNKIAMDLILAPDVIGSSGDIVTVTFVVVNTSDEPLSNVKLRIQESLFSGEPYKTSLKLNFFGDPNRNGTLDPEEVWYYKAVKTYDYREGDVFIISASVAAAARCGQVSDGVRKRLLTVSNNNLMLSAELEEEHSYRTSKHEEHGIYPNPVTAGDYLNLPANYSGAQKIEVYNDIGQLIYGKYFSAKEGAIQRIPTSGISAGTYFVSTSNSVQRQAHRLVVVE